MGWPLAKVYPKKIGYFLEHDQWVDCLLMGLGPKNIDYFLKPYHWLDFLLMELGPKNIGYLLEPDHSIDSVLGFDCNSKVCFLLAKVGSKNIG